MDDILIVTKTIEENLSILDEVYDVLSENLLTLRLDRCSFLRQRITYLGYDVDEAGIRPSNKNIEALMEFPVPTNFKSLHSFIGLASYFRRFVKNFALVAKPLYDLLKEERRGNRFMFGPEQLETFENIKATLASRPVCVYSQHLETQLHSDASSLGFASILMQKQAFCILL